MLPLIIGFILLVVIAVLVGLKLRRGNVEKIGGIGGESMSNEVEGGCCGSD